MKYILIEVTEKEKEELKEAKAHRTWKTMLKDAANIYNIEGEDQ